MTKAIAIILIVGGSTWGCADAASMLRAMAKDPGATCGTFTTIYGKASAMHAGPGVGKVTCGDGTITVEGMK